MVSGGSAAAAAAIGGKKNKKSNKKQAVVAVLFSITLLICALVAVLIKTMQHRRNYLELLPPSTRTTSIPQPPYASSYQVDWDSIARVTPSNIGRRRRVALLNFSPAEVKRWRRSAAGGALIRAVRLQAVDSGVTWAELYPEWIDEDKLNNKSCPSFPDPHVPSSQRPFHLVAVKLPCRRLNTSSSSSWITRDVGRLHLQLSAAKLAVWASAAEVLVVSECLPLPNLFPCKHLVRRHGHAWLYRTPPDSSYLRSRIRLPVGSCDLAQRLPPQQHHEPKPPPASVRSSRQAYATVLHSSDAYVCGAIATAQSIRLSGSTKDMVALVDHASISADQRAALAAAGWQVRPMERIRNPHAVPGTYNEYNYSKLRLWQLLAGDYDVVVFVDSDQLVLRNIDFLFGSQASSSISATGNSGSLFNSGVMVLEPCSCTFEMLMASVQEVVSYNGGDQGFLNEAFVWWHRLPHALNVLKYNLAVSSPAPAHYYVMHYLGIKPWMCLRDHDCNWDVPSMRRFASDDAHAMWWALHDRIAPRELAARFCALPPTQRAALEHQRRMANATADPVLNQTAIVVATPHTLT